MIEIKNPFAYIEYIFIGKDLTDDSFFMYNIPYINRYFSFDKGIIFLIDKINFWYVSSIQHYKILATALKGKNRFIKYKKKSMEKESQEFLKFKQRCMRFFNWSGKEFDSNFFFMNLKSVDFIELCNKLGIDEKEQKVIRG